MKRVIGYVLFGFVVGTSVVATVAQGPYGPLASRIGYADDTGALKAVSVGDCGTLGPSGPMGQLIVRTDSNGALQVCGVTGGGSGDVATDTIWAAAGDLVVGTGSDTATRLAMGTANQYLRVNGAGNALEYGALPGGGFDSTTVAGSQTWGDASTDTIVWTFNRATGTDPTITINSGSFALPALTLTTPLAVAQGGTGAASASITAFNNITGYTAAGATGTTSTNVVFSTSPTLVTPTLGVATATSLDTGFGANELYDMDQHVLTTSTPTFSTLTVAAEAYGVGWSGDATVPTKDDIYDVISTIATFTDPNADCMIEWDDSGGVIECVENATILAALNALTGALDWGGLTSFEIPNAAAPTLAVLGQIGLDTNFWGTTGTVAYYDGTAIYGLVGIVSTEVCTDGQVIKYNATPDTFTCEADSTGSGSLGSNLSSTTNDITSDNNIITLVANSENLILTASANTWTLSTSTGVSTFNFGGIALRNAGLKGTLQFNLGVCQGSTASLGMNIQASGAATVSCAGSTIIHAVTTFPDSGTSEVQFQFRIPDDWDGAAMELRSQWRTSATTNDAIFQISGVCGADAEVIPTAYSATPNTVTETAKGTTLQMNDFSITMSVAAGNSLATCAAGETFYGRFFRDPSGSDTLATDVTITAPLTIYYGKL